MIEVQSLDNVVELDRPAQKSAVVLLSGGIDSAVTLAIAKRDGLRLNCLTFDYGQTHGIEVEAARLLGQEMAVERHVFIDMDLRVFGGSALTDHTVQMPRDRTLEQMARGISENYVPSRNTIFLSYALAFAEVTQSDFIYMGANADDQAGYPDCRPEYFRSFNRMAKLATKISVEGKQHLLIDTPLLYMNKVEIIQLGLELGVDFRKTWSCYSPQPVFIGNGGCFAGYYACSSCDACTLRWAAFSELGLIDQIPYVGRSL